MFPSNQSNPPNYQYPSHHIGNIHQEQTPYNMHNNVPIPNFPNNNCMYSDLDHSGIQYRNDCIDCNPHYNNMSPQYNNIQSQRAFHPQYQPQQTQQFMPSTRNRMPCSAHIEPQQRYYHGQQQHEQQQHMNYGQQSHSVYGNNMNTNNNTTAYDVMNRTSNTMNRGYMNVNRNNNNAFGGNVYNEQQNYSDCLVPSIPYIKANTISMPSSSSSSTISLGTNDVKEEIEEDMTKKHVCTECGKRFRYLSLLDRHITSHSKDKPFPCDYKGCNKRFQHKYYLHQHIRRTHEAIKKHQCTECDKAFVEKCNLKIHLRKHTGEKPYQCALCLRRFSVKTNLDAHLRIHNNEKPFKCEICDKRFARKAYLTQHIRVHTGEKPFECQYCGKRCSQIGDLKKHIRIHTGEKPYKCEICDKKFRYSSHLKSHSRKLHPNLQI